MTKLPVFSTIGQGMAVFGLHMGKLLVWALFPLLLGGGAVGATVALAAWQDALGKGFNLWLVPIGVALLFAFQTSLPFSIRVNQLSVLGRVEKTGYLEMIFSPLSFRYLGYACIVGAVMAGGVLLALAPALAVGFGLAGAKQGALMGVAGLVSFVLFVALIILTSPLSLVYPAVAVEDEPSLAQAYNLGAHNKLRLFWCLALSTLLFGVLGGGLDLLGKAFGEEQEWLAYLILLPAHLILTMFSYVASVAIPAVAYRVLTGLPDPTAAGEAGPDAALGPKDESEPPQAASPPEAPGGGPGA
jgi:hypothetical protein